MDAIKKILHPGVDKSDSQHYHAGVGDTTHHTASEVADGGRKASQPVHKEGDDRAGVGMGYGPMDGVDTRHNQFEHDMKAELKPYSAPKPVEKYHAGVGDTTHHTSAEAKDGGRRASQPVHREGDDRAGVGMGYGSTDGIDTRTNQFEKDMRHGLSNEQRSGFANTPAVGGATHAPEPGITGLTGTQVGGRGAEDFEDGHSDTEGAAGSHARAGRQIKESVALSSSPNDKFKTTTPAAKTVAPVHHGLDFEDGHSDTEGGAGGKVVKTGHSDPARSTTGPHQTFIANALDPRADAGVDSRRRGSINQY